jgi:hypothetical protein
MSASGAVMAGVTLVLVAVVSLVMGPVLFDPGGLSALSKGHPAGGVASHAQLGGNCDACHTPPWSRQTMSDRCVVCHEDVASQIRSRTGLHGWLVGGLAVPTCRGCHTDHRGPDGNLTDFDHNSLPFKLTGKHRTVPCDQCHASAKSLLDFQNTPQACFSCHAKDDNHKGSFGEQCGQCHSTDSWANAKFDHTIFPINHGNEGGGSGVCTTCHPTDVSTYTCYGCHQHTQAGIQASHRGRATANLNDCLKCHAGGRGGGG